MSKDKRHQEPSKFHKFFEQMQILLEDKKSVILTDKEILIWVNQQLEYQDQVSPRTFDNWKGKSNKNVENQGSISAEEASAFRQAIAYARVNQKMNLTGNVMDEDNKNQWGSTWILERKFDDLKKQPLVQLNSNPDIRIEAGDAESRKMIEDLINGDVIDIAHSEVNDKPQLSE